MEDTELISATEAASRRGVSRQAVYQALDSGTLTEYRTGNTRLVVTDEAFSEWVKKSPQPGTATGSNDSPNS